MNIISKIKGCLALAVVAAGFAAWAATVPTDAQGFDYTTDGVTFLPGDYCVVDLTTGKVTEMKDVASAATFNTDEYKTTKMAFRYVPAGKFKANCAKTTSIKSLVSNDVALSAYWIAVFPVTEAQYNAVMGGETTSVKPKESILWDSFRGGDWTGWDGTYANVPAPGDGTFVKALNDKVAAAGCADMFDLCTSFQWERAARAGTRTDYFFSDKTAAEFGSDDDFPDLWNYAWFAKNFPSIGVQNVGGKLPNAWGLYDVYGNAYEQCLDWHEGNSGLVKDKSLEDYAGASSNSYSNRVVRGGHYTSDAGKCSSVFRTYQKTSIVMDAGGFRLIRKPATSSDPSVVPAISAKSAKFTVDLRGEIALAKGAVTVAGVSYSDTAWGAADAEDVKLCCTNVGTRVTDVLKTGLSGEDVTEVDLPQKDGDYRLTHSTGDLTSFVKFTVMGYPLGSEGNPWEIGANAAAEVIAFSNGTGTVTFKPVRGTVTKAGLETITNAMGGASFAAKLIAADGSKTNDLVMVLGASGKAYESIADALAANEASYTLFETKGYFVSYDANGAAGEMATDTFVPTISTNLTANAYTAVGYAFEGWTTNGCDEVAYADMAAGVDFAQPGETLALKAKWTNTGIEVATFDALTNALAAATNQAASLPVTVNLTDDITVPQGGVVKVYARPAVTFAGAGKFDVTAERPALFCGYSVATGLKPEDLGRFVTDKDVKAYYEDGKVVVRGRGETEEFPWLIGTDGHEDEVTAWAGDGMIFTKPTRGTASVAALQSVTNALGGYVPDSGELKVISADGTATNDVVMLLGSDGVPYDTLAEVLAADPMPETVKLYEVKGANIEFNAMGGVHTNGLEVLTNFCIVTYTLPKVEREDYTFLGWYDGWTNGAAVVSNGWDLLRYEPHTLYAKWESVSIPPEKGKTVFDDGGAAAGAAEVTIVKAKADQSVTDANGVFAIPDNLANGSDGAAVTKIDKAAFASTVYTKSAIKSLRTSLYLTEIGEGAFNGIAALKKVSITPSRDYRNPLNPVDLKIGKKAFANTGVEEVYIPAEVKNIEISAFQNCSKLKKVVFGGDETITFGSYAFYRCSWDNGGAGLKIYMSKDFQNNNGSLITAIKSWNTGVQIYEKAGVAPLKSGGVADITGFDPGSLVPGNIVAMTVKVPVEGSGTPDVSKVTVLSSGDMANWTPIDPTDTAAFEDGTVLIEFEVPPTPSSGSQFFRVSVQ